jgi:SAM-dependent methyltransferase
MANAPSINLAITAVHCYKHREMEPADSAFHILEARQTKNGHFHNQSARDRILTVKHYLDAAQLRVAASFETHGQDLPHNIDPSDGRMVTVREWFQTLPANAAVADVGCGPGRFLLHLAEQAPEAELTGIDPCPTLLGRLPARIHRHKGTLLRTRLPDATFDGAFAVESLEHSLVAPRGIAELCRIVRPGGRVLVIDKLRSKQALSEYEPWERWFHPHELTKWLEPFCDEITVEPVTHSEGLGQEGLFLAAMATRR